MTPTSYRLRFPPEYDSEEWIWTSKGYLVVEVDVDQPAAARYMLTIRDPTRLAQDIEAELDDRRVFSESNVVVVRTVDRSSIELAVKELAEHAFPGLAPQ